MTPTRLRVLHVVQNLNYGGMERVIADLMRGLDRTRFDPHLLTLQYQGRFSEGLAEFATLHQAPVLPSWTMLWPGPLARIVRDIAPDVVHSHSGVWYKAAGAARAAEAPRIIHTEHGRKHPDPWTDRVIDRLASRRTDVVVGVSELLADHLRRRVVTAGCRVVCIPNGVDTQVWSPGSADERRSLRAELGLEPERPIVGSIGRLEPIKGYDIAVEACARLAAQWKNGAPPVLVVAGDGSERARLERKAVELGVGESVRFLGWRDDAVRLLRGFSLFTLSSWSEGTSISLLEAMAAGCCPVVTDVGGNAAVLGTGLRHRLVPAGDPARLAEAWIRALEDTAGLTADRHAARSRVLVHYHVPRMVAAYQELYEEAAGRGKPTGKKPK